MALNFNSTPYFDDFDPTKNFHRILFKPGYAVQARELTQSQTILQNQISNFASNIFSTNTPISGGKVTTNLNCYYLKLNLTYNNVAIVAADFLNKIITDTTGTIIAKVIATTEATGTSTNPGDPPTLIVTYQSGVYFTDGEEVVPNDGSDIGATTIGSAGGKTSTGLSSVASISDGVFYIVNGYSQSSTVNQDGTYTTYSIGNFVQVNERTIILNKYSNTPSYRVGLEITETIHDYIDDPSLLDPAIGASNYQAPGADRYVINLTLTSLPISLGNDNEFIELVRIVNGQIVNQVDGTVYSTIDDYFAKRDYETNGDYLVAPFTFTPSTNAQNRPNKYDLSISKGIAYVHGYRIENQSPLTITSDRAQNTQVILVNDVYLDYGSYYYVDTLTGFFNVTNMPSVNLHCVPAASIITTNTNTYSATSIGTANIRDLVYVADSGTSSSYVFKAYISDFLLNNFSGNTSTGTSSTLTILDPSDKFSSVANAYYNMTISITGGTSAGDVRTIVSYSSSKVVTVDSPFTVTPDTTTAFTISPSIGSVESIVIPSGSSYSANVNINIAFGKVNGISTGDSIFENPGTPEMIFPIGNPYVANLSSTQYSSTKTFINNSTGGTGSFTLSVSGISGLAFVGQAGSTITGSTLKQNYTVINTATGKILNYTAAGSTVSLSSDSKTLTFTNSSYNSLTVDVIANVNITDGDVYPILKWKNLVTGNTSTVTSSATSISGTGTSVDLSMGQTIIQQSVASTNTSKISLYVADVKKVVAIYDTGSASITPVTSGLSSYTNVTNQYVFNNGQKDSYYDYAYISLIAGANAAKGNLLVIFNYYSHINGSSSLGTGTAGDGYFSVESYLTSSNPDLYQTIPQYTASNGLTYRLSDCLDFRPSRVNAQSTFAFEFANGGALLPQDLSTFSSAYGYYLGRKDLLVLSKDKSFQIIEGSPSVNPIFPTEPNGALILANLTLDPYTAYVPGENPPGVPANLSVNTIPHNRWAKSDITDLQTRVNNLEYYTSLSVLEQNAQSLQIPDVNGLNRFKNGILVDDFSSFSTADTNNPDFSSNINVRQQQLGPVQIVDNFQLQNPIVASSLGTLSGTNTWAVTSIGGTHTNLFTLPYTTANVIVQALATSDVSLNPFAVTVYQGSAQLYPPMDNWVDNNQAPALLITDPNMQVTQQTYGVNLTNAGDFATIPGTAVTTTSSTSVVNHGNPSVNSPYGSEVGYTATTTSTYASQLQNVTTVGNSSTINSTLNLNNGYLTNISILPYIRPQQIGFNVKGMLANCPVSVWFDGTNIDQYITSPNTIELTGVSGSFSTGDIVGFYTDSQFFPVARCEGTYVYPGTSGSQVRLYVSSILGAPTYTTTNVVQNQLYDSNGSPIFPTSGGSTASGTVNSGVSPIHSSGQITGVGGGYTFSGSTFQIYAVQDPNEWCSFMNQYAVWGDLNNTSSYSATFILQPQTAGVYTFQWASTGTSTTISANGSVVVSSSTPSYTSSTIGTYTISSGQIGGNLTLSWSVSGATSATVAGVPGIALVISDPLGNQVFTSTNPPNIIYDQVSQELVMPQGGAWFTGVTAIKLDQNATGPTATYYEGAQISITSTYVYSYTVETATYVPPPPAPSGGGGGGGKIICNKLAQMGYFDKSMNEADQRFGLELKTNDRLAYLGYVRWAQTVVDLMDGQGSEKLRKVILFWIKDKERRIEIQKSIVSYYIEMLAKPWAEEMAYRMKAPGYEKSNPAGNLIMSFGLPLCRKIGKIQTNKSIPLTAKILLIWGTVTVLLASVVVVSGTNAIINKIKSWFKKESKLSTINN